MIIVRSPLRISFVGGGTDLPGFYTKSPGRVISATINKYIYLVINPAYEMNDFILKYQETERVRHPRDIVHSRFRETLLDYNIGETGLEIGSFADVSSRTGLGSSSSFTVALVKGLNSYLGKSISREFAATEACRLEIDVLHEPIGKQDQYAAAYGGLNVIQFNTDNSVDVDPVLIDYLNKSNFEDHLLLFYTGITRDASSVLSDQSKKIEQNMDTYIEMSNSVFEFKDNLMAGNYKKLAEILHKSWLRKKSLSDNISNSQIDDLYQAGITAGAWGGKILGAGGGGCLLFIAPPEKHHFIRQSMINMSQQKNMQDSKEISIKLTQSGSTVIYKSNA